MFSKLILIITGTLIVGTTVALASIPDAAFIEARIDPAPIQWIGHSDGRAVSEPSCDTLLVKYFFLPVPELRRTAMWRDTAEFHTARAMRLRDSLWIVSGRSARLMELDSLGMLQPPAPPSAEAQLPLLESAAQHLAAAEGLARRHQQYQLAGKWAIARAYVLSQVATFGASARAATPHEALDSAKLDLERSGDELGIAYVDELSADIAGTEPSPVRAEKYEAALRRGGSRWTDGARARLLSKAGTMRWYSGQLDSALTEFRSAILIQRGATSDLPLLLTRGDDAVTRSVVAGVFLAATPDDGRTRLEEAARVAETRGDRAAVGRILHEIGQAALERQNNPIRADSAFKRALTMRLAAGDDRGTALTLRALAATQIYWTSLASSSNSIFFRRTLEVRADSIRFHARAALPYARGLRDPELLSRIYLDLAFAERIAANLDAAEHFVDSARAVLTGAGKSVAPSLWEAAVISSERNDLVRAQQLLSQFTAHLASHGDSANAAVGWTLQSLVLAGHGEADSATAVLRRAEQAAIAGWNDSQALVAARARAELLARYGRPGASDLLRKAVGANIWNNSAVDIVTRYREAGRAYLALGRPDSAAAALGVSQLWLSQAGDDIDRATYTAVVRMGCGSYFGVERAEALVSPTHPAFPIRDRLLWADYLSAAGDNAARLGQPSVAISALERAEALLREAGLLESAASVQASLIALRPTLGIPNPGESGGETARSGTNILDGVTFRSVEEATVAASSADSTENYAAAAAAWVWLARHYARGVTIEALDSASVSYERAATAIAEIETQISDDLRRVQFNDLYSFVYREWANALLSRRTERGRERSEFAALAALDQSRARALRAMRWRRDEMLRSLFVPTTAVPAPTVNEVSADEGRTLIDQAGIFGEVIVSYLVTTDSLILFVSGVREGEDDRGLTTMSVPVRRDTLVATIDAYRAALRQRAGQQPSPTTNGSSGGASGTQTTSGARLAAWLIPPGLEELLPDSGALAIIPDGPISLVPFAALQPAERTSPLGFDFAIRYSPSVELLSEADYTGMRRAGGDMSDFRMRASLEASREAVRRTTPWRDDVQWRRSAVIVADPRMPLIEHPRFGKFRPSQVGEAAAGVPGVAQMLGANVLTDSEATKARVLAELPRAGVAIFGTHAIGFPEEEWAAESFLVLASATPASDGSGQDALLKTRDLIAHTDYRLVADMVVLSACQTAVGSAQRTEGVLGLHRAFLAAGAETVVASLWTVHNEATGKLMEEFFKAWLSPGSTLTKPEALRRAQRRVYDLYPEFRDPAHWAAFQVIGAL
jgi:CHAT domain-containing protein